MLQFPRHRFYESSDRHQRDGNLKACAGILPFEEGQILIAGQDMKARPLDCKQQMAYIPDNPDLYEFMSGIRFLNFIGDVFRVEPTVRRERIHKYAQMLEIEGDLAQPLSAFSHGMKQKLALIAAWIHEPKLILMDEPFVGLDPKASHLLKELMHEHCDKGGAIFFSTHVLDVAEKLCDKVAIIKEGRLIASGSMQEVTDDIKKMLYESGPVKAVFYCPLVGEVTDEEGFSSPVDGRFLKSYAWAIEEALEADTADDEMDMAEFFDEDDGVKAKLVSAKWGVETYRGRLFGRIECSLKEELTDAETEILTDWISGQNSDGYGEHFEQQPIDTEDGDLYVSFWNSGDNYSIMTRDELDEYIDNQGMTMGGM